jgi:hypothetical protein
MTADVTSFAASFIVQDSASVDLTLFGSGTLDDPFLLSATSSIGMSQLSDWDDPAGPVLGDVPVWNGLAWEAAPPPTVPPGTVFATTGLTGDGTLATPIKVAVSDTTSTSTSGLGIYVDSAGKLRAAGTTTVAWGSITGVPATFPSTWATLAGKPSAYPDSARIGGHALFVQTAAPTSGMIVDDLWVRKP